MQAIQLVAVYEVCYSNVEGEGVIYTKHRIVSPSLLLLEIHQKYKPDVLTFFTSSLDEKVNLKKLEAFSEVSNKVIHTYLPFFHMQMIWARGKFLPSIMAYLYFVNGFIRKETLHFKSEKLHLGLGKSRKPSPSGNL